jgi:hypothetical protein
MVTNRSCLKRLLNVIPIWTGTTTQEESVSNFFLAFHVLFQWGKNQISSEPSRMDDQAVESLLPRRIADEGKPGWEGIVFFEYS